MKILICDDHKIVRAGLKQILQQMPETLCVEEAQDGDEAISLIKDTNFDIVLLDISLPGKNGLEVLQIIKKRSPSTNILILSMHSEEQYSLRALKLGASGYLTKDTASEELLLAVKKISGGGKYISAALAESIAFNMDNNKGKAPHELLSDREFDIMLRIAKGFSLVDIGSELFISIKTVSTYRTRIMSKMQMSKNADLTMYCISNELI